MVLIIPSSLLKCSPGNLKSNEKNKKRNQLLMTHFDYDTPHIPDS